jgi:AcrR family transcriptional regulator
VNNEHSPPHTRRSQAERRAVTRRALLTAGRRLFAERGVAAVSAEVVVAEAGVTRGALHDHFGDKNGLFRAVFVQLEEEVCATIIARIDDEDDVAAALLRGIGWFLDICQRPDVRQIALLDAPAVLGWAQWRQIETEYALGVLTNRLRAAEQAGISLPGPVEAVGSMLFAATIDAALTITGADDPIATRAQIEPALHLLSARALGIDRPPATVL